MENMKKRISDAVRQIDELNREIGEHWSKIQQLVANDKLDEAISILNAYFRLKLKLEQVEAALQSTLKGSFSGK
jgi:hypothetical protein